jgi:hypothetical protein
MPSGRLENIESSLTRDQYKKSILKLNVYWNEVVIRVDRMTSEM